jgi:hypothetical protein
MTKYTEIKGQAVQTTSGGNPNDLIPGQIWYDGESYSFKLAVEEAGSTAWQSGGNLITGRKEFGATGTLNAGLGFGGYTDIGITNTTEEYNGTSWTSGGNLNTGNRNNLAGAGTQTAALAFGGMTWAPEGYPNGISTSTEEYDGTSWTAGGNLNTAIHQLAGAGTQTAGLTIGGNTSLGGNYRSDSEEYDGTSWTAGGTMSLARAGLAGAGTQTAALGFGGYDNNRSNATEEYNGSAWQSGGNLTTSRDYLAGAGTPSAGLAFGGDLGGGNATDSTEEYNGTSWSAGDTLGTSRRFLGGAGEQTSALAIGGGLSGGGSNQTITEEYTAAASITIKTITVS